MEGEWFYLKNGKARGPRTWDKILELYDANKLNKKSKVWTDEYSDWIELNEVLTTKSNESKKTPISTAKKVTPPPLPVSESSSTTSSKKKKRKPTREDSKTSKGFIWLCIILVAVIALGLIYGIKYDGFQEKKDSNWQRYRIGDSQITVLLPGSLQNAPDLIPKSIPSNIIDINFYKYKNEEPLILVNASHTVYAIENIGLSPEILIRSTKSNFNKRGINQINYSRIPTKRKGFFAIKYSGQTIKLDRKISIQGIKIANSSEMTVLTVIYKTESKKVSGWSKRILNSLDIDSNISNQL